MAGETMKVKCQPEDFRVEEQADFAPSRGRFALYRLEKTTLGTPEAIDIVARRWNIARRAVSYGGLKDRHAVTRQLITIRNGPARDLTQDKFDLTYVGQTNRPFGPQDITGNRFDIVLRDVEPDEVQPMETALRDVRQTGLPNYFDDQRFGSVGESGEFIAQAWCTGNWERALWLALAEPNSHDRSREREQKELLRTHWKDWQTCKASLSRSHRRSIVTYLADKPTDFRGAFGRVRRDLRGLYLSAWQSFLWNRFLATFLESLCQPEQLAPVETRSGQWPFPQRLDAEQQAELRTLRLPLPSTRIRHQEGPLLKLFERVAAEAGISLREFRIKYPRDSFFSKGQRSALFQPESLSWETGFDELYSGRQKLVLHFVLPRGSYATILIKWISQSDCGESACDERLP